MSNNWQNRIYNHEETPPANAWDNIAKKLDAIDEENNAPVKTIVKNTKIIYWRIAAAACIIGVIATSIIWLNNNQTTTVTDPVIAAIVPQQNIAETPSEVTTKPLNDVVTNNTGTLEKKTAATLKNNFNSSVERTTGISNDLQYATTDNVNALANNPTLNKAEKLKGTTGEVINDISLMNSPNSYVTFTGPNGQDVKVSSKFSNLLGYMDGKDPESEEYLDKIVNESNFWRGKFKNWRNKMINNDITPSPSNFMNIVELSKLPTEN